MSTPSTVEVWLKKLGCARIWAVCPVQKPTMVEKRNPATGQRLDDNAPSNADGPGI
jgi:hypothetical protein